MAEKRTPSKKQVPVTLDIGKMPPQAVELEEAVLGAIMIEKDAIIEVIDILKPESFYKEEHNKIYQAIMSLFGSDKAIDILTIPEELRKLDYLDEVGGIAYVTQLTSRVASAAHIEYHARIVQQKFIQRELIRVASEIQAMAFDESTDVDNLLDFSESQLFNVAQGHIKKEAAPMNVLIKDAITLIQEAAKREDNLSGIPSGYTKLDRITSGWQPSDLVIIAARPSMGKTAFVLSMARNMAVEHNKSVAIFSLEMASVQLVNRLIVAEAEIPSDKIRVGNLTDEEWERLDYRIKRLEDAKIFIDDTPAISIFELRAKCRRLKRQHDIDVVIIDYLQLMSGTPESKGNREQEVSNISRALKSIAKELNVPVLALSQLNRSVEVRTGSKRPQLSDLRESGAIEQDADMVAFIHRPEKYGIMTDEEGNSLKGLAEIILAKHRNGALGDVILKFVGEFTKFTEMDDDYFGPVDMDSEGENGSPYVTIGSKMNKQKFNEGFGNNDLPRNSDFSEEVPF
ncbi:MAG: replicative DNA helicase [Bacteroidales bacterium]|nr:replicative DNA helicase [Bacteroidales bacterium]